MRGGGDEVLGLFRMNAETGQPLPLEFLFAFHVRRGHRFHDKERLCIRSRGKLTRLITSAGKPSSLSAHWVSSAPFGLE